METGLQTKKGRQRKALLVLPLVIIPFLTLAFWALGGGKGSLGNQQGPSTGLNVHLPDPQLKEAKGLDKLSFYREAEKGASKELQRLDAYLKVPEARTPGEDKLIFDPAPYSTRSDPNEEKVYRRMAQLQRQLQNPVAATSSAAIQAAPVLPPAVLDRGMPPRPRPSVEEDPQLAQLNAMMDKILDIQHPERVKEKEGQALVKRGHAFIATKIEMQDMTTLLLGEVPEEKPAPDQFRALSGGFYSLEESVHQNQERPGAIEAVVHQTQTLESGAIIKLRLVNDISVNGIFIPKGQLVYGTAFLDDERLKIRISSIRHGSSLLPVRLSAYDLDGIEGLYIPGVRSGEVAKSATQRVIQGMSLNTFGLPPGVQAAGAGLEAAKNLVSRKVRTARATVKESYQLLLQNE